MASAAVTPNTPGLVLELAAQRTGPDSKGRFSDLLAAGKAPLKLAAPGATTGAPGTAVAREPAARKAPPARETKRVADRKPDSSSRSADLRVPRPHRMPSPEIL